MNFRQPLDLFMNSALAPEISSFCVINLVNSPTIDGDSCLESGLGDINMVQAQSTSSRINQEAP